MQALTCNFGKIERALSHARLVGYQTIHAKKINLNPISIYRWNIALSEQLYPLLHAIEVGLRNAIFNAIAKHTNNQDWLLTAAFLDSIETQKIQKQAQYLERSGKLDSGHLIAELTFGFWCSLLDRRYEYKQMLWPTLLKAVFPYLKDCKIHLIRKRLNRIRRLRNRVYHYEPIWHWRDLLKQYYEIVETIKWIEPELLKLTDIRRFFKVYHLGPQ